MSSYCYDPNSQDFSTRTSSASLNMRVMDHLRSISVLVLLVIRIKHFNFKHVTYCPQISGEFDYGGSVSLGF